MIRRLASWLHSRLVPVGDSDNVGSTGWDAGPAADSSDDESGFLPSRLDASVLEAHGFGTTAAEKELENVQSKAEMLEDERPDP